MAKLLVSILLLCFTSHYALAQYGRSPPPRSSSSGGYGSAFGSGAAASSSLLKPTSKPSSTGGYGGSYGGIYDNPSSDVEEIGSLDEELEEVEQPEPVQPLSGPAPVRGGYGTFRPQGGQQQQAQAQAFNGIRYAPQTLSSGPARPFGRSSFTTARPRVNEDELGEEVLPLDETADDSASGARSSTLSKPKMRPFASYGAGARVYGPNTQFAVPGGAMAALSQRRQNAAIYGGSVPQLFSANNVASAEDDDELGDDNSAELGGSALQDISSSRQYGNGRSVNKKRNGASPAGTAAGARSLLGGSVPSYGAQQGQRSALGGSSSRPQGSINAAVQSTHSVEFRDHPSESTPVEPITIEVAPNQNEIQFRFNSASSKLNIENQHEPSPGSYSETQSEDEPHVLRHTVTRPIFQEVREIITPSRKVIQEIQPVQEEVISIVAKSTKSDSEDSTESSNGAAAANAIGNGQRQVNGGGKAKSSGSQRTSSSSGYGSGGRSGGSASSGSFGSSASPFGFSTQSSVADSAGGFGFGSPFGGVSTPKSVSALPKPKKNGAGSYSNGNGNGQARMTMSFNYGPASTSYSSDTGLTSSIASPQKAPKSNAGNGKPKNGGSGLSSQTRSGGYGSTFADDNQSTGAVQVDRVGNGVAYKMMTFTMGADAMKKQNKAAQSGPSSSSRSGYGSSRSSAPEFTGRSSSGARSAALFAASTVPSVQGPQRRRGVSAGPKLLDALVEDELDNGEINVDLFEDEPATASATGGAFIAAAKPKSSARSGALSSAGYRGQLGRTRSSYKRAASS